MFAKRKLLFRVLKLTGVYKFFLVFLVEFFFIAFLIFLVEPTITNYGDAVWFSFVSIATIGYGDIIATTLLSRLLIAFLIINGIIMVALITGTFVSFYTEIAKANSNDTFILFMDKLERLDELSKEELKDISKAVRIKRSSFYKNVLKDVHLNKKT